MVEYIKTCDQYPYNFNFDHFFSSIILPPFCWGKYRFPENAVQVKWVTSYSLAESFAWGNEQKWKDSIFWLANVSCSNLNIRNFSRGSCKFLGMPVPKRFCVPWRIARKQISRKTFLEKYNFIPLPLLRGLCPENMVGGIYIQVSEKF